MKRKRTKNATKFKVHIDDDLYTEHICKRKCENFIFICDLLGILKKYLMNDIDP